MSSGQQRYTMFETTNGFVALSWNDRGITGLRLPSSTEQAAVASILRRQPSALRADPSPTAAELINQIARYFAGEQIHFADVAVDLGRQSAFFASVYDEIRKLGWGHTTTYGGVAKLLGAEPQAARDVGQAMATNPVPLIVPCHRVLAAGGEIGGFSAPGGSYSKARMLEIEGVTVVANAPKIRRTPSSEQMGFGF